MPIVPFTEMVNHASANHYAVPHFNVCNLEMVQAVANAAERLRSPVIFGIHPTESDYAGADNLAGLIRSEVGGRRIRAAIHLDHGSSVDEVLRSLRAGYTSVMFDGSTLALDENVRITSEVVRIAQAAGISSEAEVGTIGRRGEYGETIQNPHLASPDAAEVMAGTGIDALAVAIGNAHGVYVAEPKLDLDLLGEIRRRTGIPLVLHGGSGIPADQVQAAIARGIAKVNVGTNLHVAFTTVLRDRLTKDVDGHDVTRILGMARAAVEDVVQRGIEVAMSAERY